jgi:hypothetical protein
VITIIHVSYIPEWKTDAEHSHMDEVWADMSNLKSDIDILSVALSIDQDSSLSMSVPVKMGGGNLPVVGSGKTSGRLEINNNGFGMRVEANNETGQDDYDSGSDLLSLGSITYISSNHYYIDQTYEYENGALIVAQGEKSLMKLSPGISIQKEGGEISVSINAVEIMGAERSISSNSFEEIHLNTNSSDKLYDSNKDYDELTIIVNTNYPDAWERFFNTTADNVDLKHGPDYTVSSNGGTVIFDLDPTEDIKLYVQKNSIRARLDIITL